MNRQENRGVCEGSLDLLEAYLDGDLPAEEAGRIQEHLAACPSCAAELAFAEKIQRELRALPLPDCPPEVLEKVYQAGKGEVVQFQRRPRRERTLGRRIAAVAAALVLSVGGGALFFHAQRQQQIAQAEQEARYALAYIGKLSRQTGLEIRDEVIQKRVVAPTTRGIARSLGVSPAPEEAALTGQR